MDTLEKHSGYQFKDPMLLKLALTHPSMAEEKNNQRLEFLGDGILGAIIAHLLYETYPAEPEGDLARRQAALVCGDTLVEIAKKISLPDALILSKSEQSAGGKENSSTLEDALEALIGAIYLDGGYSAAETFIKTHWGKQAISLDAPPKDAKTALQEWAQSRGLPLPSYELLKAEGAAHEPVFTIQVTVQGHPPTQASAKSKRNAEQLAAEVLLQQTADIS